MFNFMHFNRALAETLPIALSGVKVYQLLQVCSFTSLPPK